MGSKKRGSEDLTEKTWSKLFLSATLLAPFTNHFNEETKVQFLDRPVRERRNNVPSPQPIHWKYFEESPGRPASQHLILH